MAKISLCLIVGNVEEYIARCLTSFAPIADEICVVRAIGNQDPDRTLEIAREQFGAITGEYINAPAHADWPHVDNFAAARQMSFCFATGDYCFWCDSDDILEAGAEHVRELADRGGYAAFVFPYNIHGKGVMVPRERMILKTAGKWRYPVHECFEFAIQPVKAIEDQRVIVTHLPHNSKTGSNERNLRILRSIPEEEMNAGLWYHLQGELAGAGDIPGSVAAARRALACPEIGKPEKYELFLNLARLSDIPAQKESFLHEAFKADPERREALCMLACLAMDSGKKSLALSFARQMAATLEPAVQEWNHRPSMYDWLGDDVYMQALRCNGLMDEAETIRREGFKRRGQPRIALIHATRGRPFAASQARKVWLDHASRPELIEHIFVVDDDDRESDILRRFHHLSIPAGGGCVAAWNHGALATIAPVIIQLSDDWNPLPKWDDLILERIGDTSKEKVLAISDGIRSDKLLCMAIMTRAYFVIDHFMFHPWFTGVYSDNWFTELAYARGAVIEARDLVFAHDHPAAGKRPMDETYLRQNAPERYEIGRTIIEDLRQQRDWSSIPGFFDYWNWYQYVARWVQDGDILVEVGVWLGRSITFLAQELQRQGKHKCRIYAVDHFKGESNQREHEATVAACGGNLRAAFEANIKRCHVSDMITIIDGDSAEAASFLNDQSIAFCYIDAAHDHASVTRDLQAWLPKVKPGGIISGHDARWHEVRDAVNKILPDARIMGNIWARL